MNDPRALCTELRTIAAHAARIVLEVYAQPFAVELKGPGDPVTLADQRANEWITTELTRRYPQIPIVAEESDANGFSAAVQAERAFFVDPVDGTSEFVKKTGEFCVMIGYVERGAACVGVIHAPVLGTIYEGFVGDAQAPAFATVYAADGSSQPLVVADHDFEAGLAVISRSHYSEATDAALDRLRIGAREPYGSAGLKAMRVAEGSALVYLHAGYAGSRWDLAAPEAIARGAGASYTDLHGVAYRYDEPEIENRRGVLGLPARLYEEAMKRLT